MISAFLRDHYRRRIRVTGRKARHDRGVDHAEVCQTVDTELIVDNRHWIVAHFTSAYRVVERCAGASCIVEQLFVTLAISSRQVLGFNVARKRWRSGDRAGNAHAADKGLSVGLGGEEVGPDRRMHERIWRFDVDRTAAFRP